jgi:hypothetical protein
MLLGLESPFDKAFLGSDLVQRHHLDADSNWNRCGARPVVKMLRALGIDEKSFGPQHPNVDRDLKKRSR